MILSFKQFNESKEFKIDKNNFNDYSAKILAFISSYKEDLRSGYNFTVKNIDEYNNDDFVRKMINIFFDKLNSSIVKLDKNFFKDEDTGYSGNKFKGSNYEKTRGMSTSEIAKLIKKELNIEFPDWVFSIKTRHGSMTSAIDVKIEDMPYSPYSEEYIDVLKTKKNMYQYNIEPYNDKFNKDLKKMKGIYNQYNMDDSNSQVDYSNTRYYGDVNLNNYAIEKKFLYDVKKEEIDRRDKFEAEWKEKKDKEKQKKEELLKIYPFKKGDKVWYEYEGNKNIPKGTYEAIITKGVNGRSVFSSYEIIFYIDKRISNGEIVKLQKPVGYKITVFDIKKLSLRE